MPRAERTPSEDLRLARFGRLVGEVLERAGRAMTIKQIEKAAGVGKSTLYRWRDGDVMPTQAQVGRYCEGLAQYGADLAASYNALGWAPEAPTARPHREREQIIDDPELRALLRALTDPGVSPAEKLRVRRLIRAMTADLEESSTPTPEE